MISLKIISILAITNNLATFSTLFEMMDKENKKNSLTSHNTLKKVITLSTYLISVSLLFIAKDFGLLLLLTALTLLATLMKIGAFAFLSNTSQEQIILYKLQRENTTVATVLSIGVLVENILPTVLIANDLTPSSMLTKIGGYVTMLGAFCLVPYILDNKDHFNQVTSGMGSSFISKLKNKFFSKNNNTKDLRTAFKRK